MASSRVGLRGLLIALPLLAASACNPDPPVDRPSSDASAEGADTAPTAPTFGGIKSLTPAGEGQLSASWDPATDPVTPRAKLAYRLYVADAPGGWDFTTPFAVAPAGATSFLLDGLHPSSTFSVVVRAVDEAGVADANTVHLEARTPDHTPPVFGGATSLVGTGARDVQVTWSAGTDNGTPPEQLVYRVYVTDTTGAEDFTTPSATSAPGATTATVTGLKEAHNYYAIVRAVDRDGNADANKKEVSGKTLDKTPPTFGGATSAVAGGTAVTISWNPATDNVDPAAAIVYDVFQSKSAGGEDFTKPTYTTKGGATSFVAVGLDPTLKYFFVVRARDTSGNEDANKVERAATTASSSDVTPPTFAGLISATGSGPSSIDLTWAAATDDFSPPSAIVYDVYVAATPGAEDYSAPSFTTPPGTTTYTVAGLKAVSTYSFVVRARDAAGNRDANTVEKTASTGGDTTPPTFAGLVSATATGPTTIRLAWADASDAVSLPGAIRYRVYQASSPGAEPFAAPILTTAGGANAAVVNGLQPVTPYYFVVRALDEAGNEEKNTVEKTATTAADVTAPTFAGCASFIEQSASSALATWGPASDDVTTPPGLVYEVYLATTPGGEPLLPTATTAAGASSYLFTGLTPSASYYVICRARDAAGNVDKNSVEKSATLPADVTPPVFGGATGVTAPSTTSLTVRWTAATDDVTPPAGIQYLICMSTTAGSCSGGGFTVSASVTGATSYTFSGLTPTGRYYFVVRAQDAAGNRDTNSVEISGVTVVDTTPPIFAGLVSATPSGATAVNLSWVAGTDDISTPGQLVYDIYMATTSGGEALGAPPTATSPPGATSFLVSGLTVSTTYYFIVRARDQAGNRDANTVERSAATSIDNTPPVFGGVTVVAPASETTLTVSWAAATDDTTPGPNIDYLLCWNTSPTACTTAFTAMATVTGSTSTVIGGVGVLQPSTSYTVVVRARDLAGNVDTNTATRSATTLADTIPPTWSGAPPVVTPVYANGAATAGQLDVSWSAASDNAWPASGLSYQLCWSSSGGCTGPAFSAMATVGPGVTSRSLTGLTSRTLYAVYIKAVDGSTNVEPTSHSASGTTATSYATDIDAAIFSMINTSGGCNGPAGCHAPLWSYSNTVSKPAPCGGDYVRPNDPSNSLIYKKMANTYAPCTGQRMPLGGPWDAGKQAAMLDWINQGAKNN